MHALTQLSRDTKEAAQKADTPLPASLLGLDITTAAGAEEGSDTTHQDFDCAGRATSKVLCIAEAKGPKVPRKLELLMPA